MLVLTTYNGRVFTSVAKLRRLIAEGKVRYAFLNTFCGAARILGQPGVLRPGEVGARPRDRRLAPRGAGQGGLLYRLPGVRE